MQDWQDGSLVLSDRSLSGELAKGTYINKFSEFHFVKFLLCGSDEDPLFLGLFCHGCVWLPSFDWFSIN